MFIDFSQCPQDVDGSKWSSISGSLIDIAISVRGWLPTLKLSRCVQTIDHSFLSYLLGGSLASLAAYLAVKIESRFTPSAIFSGLRVSAMWVKFKKQTLQLQLRIAAKYPLPVASPSRGLGLPTTVCSLMDGASLSIVCI